MDQVTQIILGSALAILLVVMALIWRPRRGGRRSSGSTSSSAALGALYLGSYGTPADGADCQSSTGDGGGSCDGGGS